MRKNKPLSVRRLFRWIFGAGRQPTVKGIANAQPSFWCARKDNQITDAKLRFRL